MSLKLDKADQAFSQYIRLRDGKCTRCYSLVQFNEQGLPVTHHASHFFGRRNESTRFDPLNVDTHCHGCHQYFTSNPAEFYQWKLNQIGQEEMDKLTLRAHTPQRKDREMEKIRWRKAVKEES